MPTLLQGEALPKIQFVVSLPHSLLATASLLCAIPRFEGLGAWLHKTRDRLDPDLLQELCLIVNIPGRFPHFSTTLGAQLPDHAPDMDFDQFRAHLESLPGAEYQRIALQTLTYGLDPEQLPEDLFELVEKPEDWADCLATIESDMPLDRVAALIRDGEQLKDRLITALTRFWREAYEQEYQATYPAMQRSVRYQQSRPQSVDFRDLFASVTGRMLPETLTGLLPSITQVTFAPSCYVGPYVAVAGHRERLILYYNCRSTPASPALADGATLYPPLKALADETRLQILYLLRDRELYAQEIVDNLDISQPAVSRHLNLMAAAGVLKIRREGNTKYYSVDRQTLSALADALRSM